MTIHYRPARFWIARIRLDGSEVRSPVQGYAAQARAPGAPRLGVDRRGSKWVVTHWDTGMYLAKDSVRDVAVWQAVHRFAAADLADSAGLALRVDMALARFAAMPEAKR